MGAILYFPDLEVIYNQTKSKFDNMNDARFSIKLKTRGHKDFRQISIHVITASFLRQIRPAAVAKPG